jgi:hypothetical protein
VNGFQPSMKLQSKQIEGEQEHRISDEAKTPRMPVHQPGRPKRSLRAWPSGQHESQRPLLGQCRHGTRLRHPQARMHLTRALQEPRAGANRHL